MVSTYSEGKIFYFFSRSPGLVPASPGLIVSRLQREMLPAFFPGLYTWF
jgi:hypothetical protein